MSSVKIQFRQVAMEFVRNDAGGSRFIALDDMHRARRLHLRHVRQRQVAYSQAEVTHALAPLRGLEQRCYAGSSSARAKHSVGYEFIAYVDERGDAHADPVIGDVRDPSLLECLRTGIDALRFPAKGADQFHLAFALRP